MLRLKLSQEKSKMSSHFSQKIKTKQPTSTQYIFEKKFGLSLTLLLTKTSKIFFVISISCYYYFFKKIVITGCVQNSHFYI